MSSAIFPSTHSVFDTRLRSFLGEFKNLLQVSTSRLLENFNMIFDLKNDHVDF